MSALVNIGKEKFEKVFNYSQDSIFIIHPGSDSIIDANPAACKLLGYAKEELLLTPISAIHPDEMSTLINFTNNVYRNGEGWTDELNCLTKEGQKINVEMSATILKLDGIDCIMVIARDISQRMATEYQLKKRVKFEELVSSISTSFLQSQSSDLNQLIKTTLQELGTYANVDRCYIYESSGDNDTFVNTCEWVKEGQPELINIQNSLDNDTFSWIHDQLRDFDTVHIPCLAQLPSTEESLKNALRDMNIKSCLVVPLNYNHRLSGFIGFDCMSTSKTWEKEDIRLLKVIGEVITNAMERKNYEDNLEKVNNQLNSLNLALELKINERAQEIISQREKLTNYAYYNAHKLRAPLARLLGLISLIDNNFLEKEEISPVVKKIQQAGGELDDIVKEINKIIS